MIMRKKILTNLKLLFFSSIVICFLLATSFFIAEIGVRFYLFGPKLYYEGTNKYAFDNSSDKKQVVFFGSSLTSGYPFPEYISYPSLIKKKYFPSIEVVNLAKIFTGMQDQVNLIRNQPLLPKHLVVWNIATASNMFFIGDNNELDTNSPAKTHNSSIETATTIPPSVKITKASQIKTTTEQSVPITTVPPTKATEASTKITKSPIEIDRPPQSFSIKTFSPVAYRIYDCLFNAKMSIFSTFKDILASYSVFFVFLRSNYSDHPLFKILKSQKAKNLEKKWDNNGPIIQEYALNALKKNSECLRNFFDPMDSAVKYIKNSGATLIVVYVPTELDLNKSLFKKALIQKKLDPSLYDSEHQKKCLIDYCKKRSISFIDQSKYLEEKSQEGQQIFLKIDRHYTRLGHELFAYALSKDKVFSEHMNKMMNFSDSSKKATLSHTDTF
ncbi:MAG: SGNH/GDSL hydrolase family protein [Oligoflexia bacterium]|nr:SGNH/GDSL hydrolase family protein [Oligoflexia bacterium]